MLIGCVFLGKQDWDVACAVGCRQGLAFLQEGDICADFA